MTIKFLKICNCVKRLELIQDYNFQTKEEQEKKLKDIYDVLKKKSCKTHKFSHRKIGENIFIDSTLNTDNIL